MQSCAVGRGSVWSVGRGALGRVRLPKVRAPEGAQRLDFAPDKVEVTHNSMDVMV
jgi:hypothetical protein